MNLKQVTRIVGITTKIIFIVAVLAALASLIIFAFHVFLQIIFVCCCVFGGLGLLAYLFYAWEETSLFDEIDNLIQRFRKKDK